jgi:2-dehydropantoate 2-reductase
MVGEQGVQRTEVKSIMTDTVAILGAGSLGAVYASRFYDLDPACISLVASGDRYHRLKRDGVIVNRRHYPILVFSPQDAAPPADLIIVALKHHHLAEALPDLRNRVGDDTAILSVMNGLDSETIIAEHYGADKTLYCIAVGIDPLRSENVINYTTSGRLVFGEADNTTLSARVRRVQQTLSQAGIPYDTPPDMVRMLWWKFMVNVGINQTSAILRAPYGVFQTNLHAQAIMEAAMREVIDVAQAAHVNLVADDIASWYKVMSTLHPQGKTSMLQDVEAGRVTEVDIFAGKMVELGELYGIPTPVNTLLLHAIKVIERDAQ